MIWLVMIAGVCGMVIGYVVRAADEEDCPRRVLQYNCKGETCDHRQSVLYTNMASMARNAEEREANHGY